MFTFETSDQKEVRRFRIAQFNGRTATVRSAGSAVTGHVRSIVENKSSVPAAWSDPVRLQKQHAVRGRRSQVVASAAAGVTDVRRGLEAATRSRRMSVG